MSSASNEIIWLRHLLAEFGLFPCGPIPLYADNTSAIRIAKSTVLHERIKHIEVSVINSVSSRPVLAGVCRNSSGTKWPLKRFRLKFRAVPAEIGSFRRERTKWSSSGWNDSKFFFFFFAFSTNCLFSSPFST